MLKKTIVYTNPLTDKQVSEDHYFHISKTDLIKLEMEEHGATYENAEGVTLTGMQAKLQRMLDSEDGKAIMREFEDIVKRSYGIKDGDTFRKTPEIAEQFMTTEAYSQFFWDLCTDAAAMSEFINGVIPGNLDQIAAEVREKAALQARGVEAQATARANAAAAQPEPASAPAEVPAEETSMEAVQRAAVEEGAVSHDSRTLAERVESATAEDPAVLTAEEVTELDGDVLKSGLATGRIKLS